MTKKEKRGAEKEIWRTSTATRKRAGDGRAPSVSSLEEDDSKAVRRGAPAVPAAQDDAGSDDGPEMDMSAFVDDY